LGTDKKPYESFSSDPKLLLQTTAANYCCRGRLLLQRKIDHYPIAADIAIIMEKMWVYQRSL